MKVEGREASASASVRLSRDARKKKEENLRATMLVEGGMERARASHECRICGRKLNEPVPRRLRGATSGRNGFHCDHCENTFCAAHVVRVSGLIETIIYGGRFRCLLCQDAQ